MLTHDDMMEKRHHALGRPTPETKEYYRNRYFVGINSEDDARFRRSAFWTRGDEDVTLVPYFVNASGLRAVREWMKTPKGRAAVRAYNPQSKAD